MKNPDASPSPACEVASSPRDKERKEGSLLFEEILLPPRTTEGRQTFHLQSTNGRLPPNIYLGKLQYNLDGSRASPVLEKTFYPQRLLLIGSSKGFFVRRILVGSMEIASGPLPSRFFDPEEPDPGAQYPVIGPYITTSIQLENPTNKEIRVRGIFEGHFTESLRSKPSPWGGEELPLRGG
jgi:hypothetical protein